MPVRAPGVGPPTAPVHLIPSHGAETEVGGERREVGAGLAELNFKEVGRVLDLTESRISQLHTQAVKWLRKRLSKAT